MAAARDVRTARGRVRRRGCTRVARFIGLLMLSARSHGQTVGDNLREIQRLAEHARAPLVTSGMAMPAFELRSVFEPFTNRFTAPAVKMTRGGDGAPVNRSDLAPQSVEQAIETVTRPHEPESLTAHSFSMLGARVYPSCGSHGMAFPCPCARRCCCALQ